MYVKLQPIEIFRTRMPASLVSVKVEFSSDIAFHKELSMELSSLRVSIETGASAVAERGAGAG